MVWVFPALRVIFTHTLRLKGFALGSHETELSCKMRLPVMETSEQEGGVGLRVGNGRPPGLREGSIRLPGKE